MGLQASQKSESLSGYEYRIVYAYARILGGYLEELRDIIKSRLATSCGHSKSLARYYTSIVPKTTPTRNQLPLGNALKITKIELTDGTIPVITYGTRAPREWHIDPSRRCKNSAHNINPNCRTCGAPTWATTPCTCKFSDPRGQLLAVDTTTPLGDAIHEITEAYRKEVQKLADAETRYGLVTYSSAHKFTKEIWLERFLRRHNITLPNFGDYNLAQQIYDNTTSHKKRKKKNQKTHIKSAHATNPPEAATIAAPEQSKDMLALLRYASTLIMWRVMFAVLCFTLAIIGLILLPN